MSFKQNTLVLVLYTDAVLREADGSSAKKIFEEILAFNEGKVVYLDFWATWCGPCLSEFPNSKRLEEELKDQDVSFVYLCLESDKEKYLATLSSYQLGGQHYFLSKQQSADVRKMFEITGIPFYVVINKEGVIQETGSHLRPMVAKPVVEKLLNK